MPARTGAAGALFLAALILLLAAFLRFHDLEAQSFWNDEGNSARIIERTPQLIVEAAAGDIHPPLYYLLLAGWRLPAGFSEFALRAFSVYCGLLTVALTYALGRRLFDMAVGALGALIVALHAFQVYYSQEARMYALMAALAAGSMYAFVRWLDRGAGRFADKRAPTNRRGSTLWGVAWALLNAAGLYTQYVFPVVMLVQAVLFLFWWLDAGRPPDRLARFVILAAAPVILYLPWLPITARQVTTWPTVGTTESLAEAVRQLAALLVYGMDVGTWGLGRAVWAAGIPLIAAAAPVFIAGPQADESESARRRWRLGLLWVWALLPVAGTLALGLYRPAFLKTLLIAHVPIALLIAWGLAAMARLSRLTGLLALVCLGGTVLHLAVGLDALVSDPAQQRADYRAIAGRIAADARPGDAVLLDAANQWEVFTYYHREDVPGNAPVYPIPRARPVDAEAVRAELDDILADHDRLFVLYWGDAEADPARVVESYLGMHAAVLETTWYRDVRFVVYAVLPGADDAPATPLDAQFGDAIRLAGYTLNTPYPVRPGDALTLTLFWRAETTVDARYKVFVHLVDASGALIAQHDSEPAADLRPTPTWGPGETVVDHHGVVIPPDAAPGAYRVLVGLYPIDDPSTRLPVKVDGDAVGDVLQLGYVDMQ